MTFRLAAILIFYQLILGGLAVYYYSEIYLRISIIMFFLFLCIYSYVINHKVKKDLIADFQSSHLLNSYFTIILFLSVLFYIIKFVSLGIPIFERNANIARVEFARSYDFLTFLFKNAGFICIIYFSFARSLKWQMVSVVSFIVFGYFSGYRSAAAIPVVLLIFTYFLCFRGSMIRFMVKYFAVTFVALSVIFALLVRITMNRFGKSEGVFWDAVIMLAERIALVNYYNFLRIEKIFHNEPLYFGSIWWDLESIFTSKMGFSGRVTEMTGFKNYETLQLTPTFLGEGFANFNDHLYIYSIVIILVLRLVVISLNSFKNPIVFCTFFTWMLFLPISSGQGLGSFLFNFTPKFLITLLYLLFSWQIFCLIFRTRVHS